MNGRLVGAPGAYTGTELVDLFTYSVDFGAVQANETKQVILRISADAEFMWQRTSYFAAVDLSAPQNEADRVIPAVGISIQDTGSGRNLQDDPVDLSSMAGHEGLPYINTVERRINKTANVNFTIHNFGNVNYELIRMNLLGYKIFSEN